MGGNSDPYGFIANLDDRAPRWDRAAGRAIVLGAGGAARSAAFGLIRRGFRVPLVNRTRQRASELAAHFGAQVRGYGFDALPEILADAGLLVNCTALGVVGKP